MFPTWQDFIQELALQAQTRKFTYVFYYAKLYFQWPWRNNMKKRAKELNVTLEEERAAPSPLATPSLLKLVLNPPDQIKHWSYFKRYYWMYGKLFSPAKRARAFLLPVKESLLKLENPGLPELPHQPR